MSFILPYNSPTKQNMEIPTLPFSIISLILNVEENLMCDAPPRRGWLSVSSRGQEQMRCIPNA